MKIQFNRLLTRIVGDSLAVHNNDVFTEFNWLLVSNIVSFENIFVFDRYLPKKSIDIRSFQDETGLEHNLNHFHFETPSARVALEAAIYLFGVVEELWTRHEHKHGIIRQIVSIEEPEVAADNWSGTYSFHVIRSGQTLLDPDLERYDQLVLVCDSD